MTIKNVFTYWQISLSLNLFLCHLFPYFPDTFWWEKLLPTESHCPRDFSMHPTLVIIYFTNTFSWKMQESYNLISFALSYISRYCCHVFYTICSKFQKTLLSLLLQTVFFRFIHMGFFGAFLFLSQCFSFPSNFLFQAKEISLLPKESFLVFISMVCCWQRILFIFVERKYFNWHF